jgi:hypothetical protein
MHCKVAKSCRRKRVNFHKHTYSEIVPAFINTHIYLLVCIFYFTLNACTSLQGRFVTSPRYTV